MGVLSFFNIGKTNPIIEPRPTQFRPEVRLFGLDASLGIPGVDVQTIMQTKEVASKIDYIRDRLSDIPHSRRKELVDDVIEAFIRHVHLLPASAYYHHNESGGLLIHSLGVASSAIENTQRGIAFGYRDGNSMRREIQPKYFYAAFLCGLFHDIGKPQGDILSVTCEGKTWDTTMPLNDWVDANVGPDKHYHIEYLSGRGFTHEELTLSEMWRMLPAAAINHLKVIPEPSVDGTMPSVKLIAARITLQAAIFNVMTGKHSNNQDVTVLTKCVSDADSMNTEAWRNKSTDISTRICNAIQHYIAKNIWEINDPQSPLIVSDKYIFIKWHDASFAINEYLKKIRGLSGGDETPDQLADILIERNIADPVFASERPVRYHKVEVEYEQIISTYSCLRIILAENIFKHGTLERIKKGVKVKIIDGGYATAAESQQPAQIINHSPIVNLVSETDTLEKEGAPPEPLQPEINLEETVNPGTSPQEEMVLPQPEVNKRIKVANTQEGTADTVAEQQEHRASNSEPVAKQKTQQEIDRQNADKWYESLKNTGSTLKVIAREHQLKKLKNEYDVILDEKSICLNTELFINRGIELQNIVNDLIDKGLIIVDKISNKPVWQITGTPKKFKYVRLTLEATTYFQMPILDERTDSVELKKRKAIPQKPNANEDTAIAKDFLSVIHKNQDHKLPFKITINDDSLAFNLMDAIKWYEKIDSNNKHSVSKIINAIRVNPSIFNVKNGVATIMRVG